MKAKFGGGSLSLTSTWICIKPVAKKNDRKVFLDKEMYNFKPGTPTTATDKISIPYAIPSGATIKSVSVFATLSKPASGISLCTMNGNNFKGYSGASLAGNAGTYVCTFSYKANGYKRDYLQHSETLTISGITLEIEYEEIPRPESENVSKSVENKQEESRDGEFKAPDQNVCIYDQDEQKIYTFDGVLKIQANLSLKIEEDPSKKKELYVNNARNEPSKVTLDVMMSDVYSGMSNLTVAKSMTESQQHAISSFSGATGESRSGRAAVILRMMKEERRMLTVLTPQDVYTDMLLQSVTINQDDSCPYGWQGQLVFQEKYEVVQPTDVTSSKATSSNVQTRGPANWVSIVGADFIK